MSEQINLEWGETPWDNLTREELLREVQRYHSALESAASVMRQLAFGSQLLFWSEGPGGKALAKAEQAREHIAGFSSETVYRSFFRYADDLLFEGMGDRWRICDRCAVMCSLIGEPRNKNHLLCHDCERKGIESYTRPITWDDLKPLKEKS